RLTVADYEEAVAKDPRIDALRSRMQVRENPQFTEEYSAPDKRYIGNAVQAFFRDGTTTPRVAIDVPIGHRKRRKEGLPLLRAKFKTAVTAHFSAHQSNAIEALFADRARIEQMPVREFLAALVVNK